jgi:DNA-binding MarR family transcriptional regulator
MRERKPRGKAELAAEVWRRLFDFIISTNPQRVEVLGRHRLTPNDSRALFSLDAKGRPMQSLAKQWACDPSNATFMVDRLEKRHLVERRALEGDRRVKMVALTAKGMKTKAALRRELYRPPPELLALDRGDLEALLGAAGKLKGAEPSGASEDSEEED